MVRIKERYILVNILYPAELGRAKFPDVVVLNQPTSNELTPAALLRAIRAEVAALFGDYGSGALDGGGFSGESRLCFATAGPMLTTGHVQSSTFHKQPRLSSYALHEPRID